MIGLTNKKKSNFHHFKYFFSWLSFFWLSNEKKEWKILFVWKDKLGNQKKNRIEFKNVILVVNLQSKSMFSSPPPYKQNNFRNQPKIKIKMKTGNRFSFFSFIHFGYQESKVIMIIGWLAGEEEEEEEDKNPINQSIFLYQKSYQSISPFPYCFFLLDFFFLNLFFVSC